MGTRVPTASPVFDRFWSEVTEKVSDLTTQQQQQQQQQPFYGPLSGTTRVREYQKKRSPTHHPDHHPIFISFFHLPQSIASSLFKLRAWQSFCTTSFHVSKALVTNMITVASCTQEISIDFPLASLHNLLKS